MHLGVSFSCEKTLTFFTTYLKENFSFIIIMAWNERKMLLFRQIMKIVTIDVVDIDALYSNTHSYSTFADILVSLAAETQKNYFFPIEYPLKLKYSRIILH